MRRHAVGYSCMLLRGGTYYFRKIVPLALRSILGKREILVSLRTKDKETAKRNLHHAALKADSELDAARRQLTQQTPELLAARWKADLLREDAVGRQAFQPKTKADLDSEIADLDATLAEVRSYLTLLGQEVVATKSTTGRSLNLSYFPSSEAGWLSCYTSLVIGSPRPPAPAATAGSSGRAPWRS